MAWERPTLGTRRDQANEIDHRANLSPRPPYTAQEAFDTMVTHLRKQGVKAQSPYAGCEYLTQDGLMCAVGCLLDPKECDPRYLEGNVYDSEVILALNKSGYPPELLPLLKSMQVVHDESPPMCWEDGFRDVAGTYNLNVPAI